MAAVPSPLLSTSVLEEPLARLLFRCHLDNRACHICLVSNSQFNGEETDTQRRRKFVFLPMHLALGCVLSCYLNGTPQPSSKCQLYRRGSQSYMTCPGSTSTAPNALLNAERPFLSLSVPFLSREGKLAPCFPADGGSRYL